MSATPNARIVLAAAALACCVSGCTGLREYVRNGFKVGPNYCPPCGPVAEQWIDADDVRLRSDLEPWARWWTVFQDPVLDRLVEAAYEQNLTLREAGFRVLQARADLAIARGNVFPQLQDMTGAYRRQGAAGNYADQWSLGFNLGWELDFWGRFRRAVQAADAQLDASIENYDDVLVTLVSDVAANYVQVRTDQERIRLLRDNVEVQRVVWELAKRRVRGGKGTDLDVEQAEATLKQTMAGIAQLQIDLRQAGNRICILLGMPPEDLQEVLGTGPIPASPPEVAVGIPADLLRRRPDVRRAERQAAAQAELIGIAESDLYPAISITGTLGYQARHFQQLFDSDAFTGNVGPSFRWNVLNYGRIINNVRFQEARFWELVAAYQNTVLLAGEEAENGIVAFLRAQERRKLLSESVKAGETARGIVLREYEAGAAGFDFNRYATIEQNLIQQQDQWAQAQGQIALALVQIYRALGGGWEIRLEGAEMTAGPPPPPAVAPETPENGPKPPPALPTPPVERGAPNPAPNPLRGKDEAAP